MSLARLAERLARGELTPREAVEAQLARIDELDGDLNAYISVRGERALAEAAALESAPRTGPLWGVPVAVKDVIDVAGEPTTAASRILAGSVAARDAFVVERLRAAGAIVLGKLNTHEFAYGATTTSPHFGPARNPWATDRVSGGSSGGSGAAAAAGLAAGTLGTDTAGSIRIPSAFCGVTGLRPTTGRVSNRGVVPVSWTFDTVGPIARTAEDCALLLEAIAGHDPEDPTTVAAPVPAYSRGLAGGAAGLAVGVVGALFEQRVDPRVAAAAEAALGELEALGARLVRVEVPLLEEAGTIQQAVMLPEAAEHHLPWLRDRLADYGPDVRARLLAGLLLPATAPVTGQRLRRVLYAGLRRLFAEVDVLAAPTMPVTAPRVGDDTVELDGERILFRIALIRFNSPWSAAGLPVVNVPCGLVDGLPVGLALVGPRLAEERLLAAAHAFQRATGWHELEPPAAAAAPAAGKEAR